MAEAKKSNIPKDKRVFLITDMTGDGKIKQVWDRRFLNGLVESYETRYNRVREANDPFFTSPLTRKKFSKNDIKAYPPTNATKRRIKQIMNGRALEAKVNKIMKIKNKDYLARSNILETIKRGIRKGTITTETQIKELALIYEVTGREMLISGHKKDGDYYTAYVKGKFKPHHIKFMKDTPYIATKLYDTTRQGEPRAPARAIVPLYKLPSSAVKYLSGFDKYVSGESPVARNTLTLIIRVLRQVVKVGYVPMAENVALRIEVERVKVKAEENLEEGRVEMYREVEKEIESRVRKSIDTENKKRIAKLRKEADKAQQFATEQAKSAAEVIEHLKATVEAEVSKQDELVREAHEKMMKAQQQKMDALIANVAALQEQNRSLLEYTASFDSLREERDKVMNALTDKEQEITMLTSAQDEMGTRMTSAIARATLAESKITQMDKTVDSRVKSAQDSAALAVDTAFKAQRAAEKRAEEQKKTSESLIAAAVVRAENAEAQLYRQNEILQEFAAMTEAKTKATELIVQLQEQITSQTVEIESLRALVSENEKRAIDYKSEVEALEGITKRKVKESISQAEDIQTAGEKKMQILMSEMKDKFEELEAASVSKDLEITALKAEIENLSAFDAREHDRFAREIAAQSELAKSWQQRADFLTKLDERMDEGETLPEEGRGRLKYMFDGPELRSFIASGWTLPKGVGKRWEQSASEEDAEQQNTTIAFDPEVEKTNRERLGTTGFSARRERPKE